MAFALPDLCRPGPAGRYSSAVGAWQCGDTHAHPHTHPTADAHPDAYTHPDAHADASWFVLDYD
jgi:hypothetical protein